MNQEFVDKMKEAKKLEGEALMSILPEYVRGHIEVIEKEIKAILLECIAAYVKGKSESDDNSKKSENKVNKVEID
jgi:hypothetical protein